MVEPPNLQLENMCTATETFSASETFIIFIYFSYNYIFYEFAATTSNTLEYI